MKNILMSKGAKTLVNVCAGVKPHENVLIVTDFLMTNIAESVVAAAYQAEAEVVISIILPAVVTARNHRYQLPRP